MMSGYTQEQIADRGVQVAAAPLMQKPFTAAALLARILASLEAPAGKAAGRNS
jgi:DNA-binding response OmpR family regulator